MEALSGVKLGVNLHWAGHQSALVGLMQEMLAQDNFLDVTLAAEGQHINVHRFALMASSPYFKVRKLIDHHS